MADEEVPISSSFFWPTVGFAVLAIVVQSIFFLAFNQTDPARAGVYVSGDNCNILTCPIGPFGPSGPSGPPGTGLRGPTGKDGKEGPQGPSGAKGDKGDPGMCLAHPSCMQGPTGPTGPSGPSGPTGRAGFNGDTGPSGPTGPMGFNGTQGPSGPSGPSGPTGPAGNNGVCDCFNISSITFDTIDVEQTLILNNGASLQCNNGSYIGLSCLVQGVCPDYSACNLKANGLEIDDYLGTPATLIVQGNNSLLNYVMFGSNLAPMDNIQMYAGVGGIKMETINGGIEVITVGGGIALQTMSVSSNIQLFAGGVVELISLDNNVPSALQSNGGWTISSSHTVNGINISSPAGGSAVNIMGGKIYEKTDDFTLDSVSYSKWMGTNPLGVSYNTGASIPATPSLDIFHNIVLQNSATISSPDQIVRIGPSIDVGSGRIFTTMGAIRVLSLQLGDFNGLEYISMEAPIINNNTFPAACTNLTDGHIVIAEPTRIIGNVLIEGDLDVTGVINSAVSSTCPPISDATVKENIQPLKQLDSIQRIQQLKPVSYNFVEHYQNECVHGNASHVGFIAQEVQKIIPTAIQKRKDLLYLDKDMLIPDMVNTILYLLDQVNELKYKCK